MNIEDILNGTKYNLTQFSQKNITSLFKEINSFSKQENVIFLFDEVDASALYMWNV